ncbi:(5-formylfuran-3-yl)methyl phosphate synthase [Paraburkholderia sp.]|uniref:(5-formylfuran-3-yl)methyl phosphate synthase n=1 Tax=Paraburkholderia sp. TaxID=1926495 RepID=UPI00239EA38C|nr:(5-formylfuran-3-yl)methyl phosphate synthase [Paraburkholderia sp.]MDE1179168.1 (5-formylfuran-3-yl)methyl phosphate synthase [Paraburkholderia sp.]
MTAMLASVRSSGEAFDAAQAGAELIDLKEPDHGALGGVRVDEIARIVLALRARFPVKPISATIGDVASDALDEIAARVISVGDAGVDYIKVGVTPGPAARRCLVHLASLPGAVVPVLLCDDGLDPSLAAYAAGLGFAGIMFDTATKDGGTLFDCVDVGTLSESLAQIRASGAMSGVAGSLGWQHLDQIRSLSPDFAGFRTALCAGGRTAQLDPERVARWVEALHRAPEETSVAGLG